MDSESFRQYCLSLPGVTECTPFDDITLVYKVGNKMFALLGNQEYEGVVSLKCDPDRAIELRDKYPNEITPAYHFNKKHWNGVRINADLPEKMIIELIDHSYNLVRKSLPRKVQDLI